MGTGLPTDDNWLQCHGCSLYYSEADIGAEDQTHQWCKGCLGAQRQADVDAQSYADEPREPEYDYTGREMGGECFACQRGRCNRCER